MRIQIFKGNTPPYHLKSKNIEEGTFIRVGSTNRQASKEMIDELERQQNNISFDSELFYSTTSDQLDKGTNPGNFIDQKTIEVPLGLQAEQAL